MAAKNSRVALKLTGDAQFVAVVAGAVGYFADQAGLDAAGRADLISSVEEACRKTLLLLTAADAALGVQIEGFSDRIEVTLEHQGQPAAVAEPSRVNHVQHDAQSGMSRMTLAKEVTSTSQRQASEPRVTPDCRGNRPWKPGLS